MFLFLPFFISSMGFAGEPKTCREIYCGNTSKLGWAPCDAEGVIQTTEFHVLKIDQEKIWVCAGLEAGQPPEIVASSVSPYNFPNGTRLIAVDEKKNSFTVSATAELFSEVAKDLDAKDSVNKVTLTFCTETHSFSTFCPDKQMLSVMGASPVRAFGKLSDEIYMLNQKGVFILDSNGKKTAFFETDATEAKLLGLFDGWLFLSLLTSDGDTTTSNVVGYSVQQKIFSNLFQVDDLEIKASSAQGKSIRFKISQIPEYSGPGTSISLAKGIKCVSGKIRKTSSSPIELDVDLKSATELRILHCGYGTATKKSSSHSEPSLGSRIHLSFSNVDIGFK